MIKIFSGKRAGAGQTKYPVRQKKVAKNKTAVNVNYID